MPNAAPTSALDVDDATRHPRPLLRRRGSSLDGPWEFADEVGSTATFDRTIEVPFSPETAASGVGAAGIERCSYRRTVEVGDPASDERVTVHFGAVDRVVTVSANGTVVGHHEGGYDPFAVDVTGAIRGGSVEITVEVEDRHDDLDAPRGKQEWLAEPHSIWYPPTTGIWRSVWVERTSAARIDALDWRPDVDAMTVGARVRIEGEVPDGAMVRVRLSTDSRVVAEGSARVLQPEVRLELLVGDGGIDDRAALAWWPRRPTLLEAEVALVDGRGDVVDEVQSYTALRSVAVDDGAVLLNGRPTFLRLVLDQGYWPESGLTPPSSDALRADLELTRALGFNGARKHQKTEDPRYFAWADRLGMLAWVEMPSAYRPGPTSARRLLDEWARIVEAHRNHPSVIAWVPVNESWGVPAAATDASQRALIDALASMTRALDGTRPVSPNDGWETLGGDIVGVHDYTQDADRLARRYATGADVDAVVRGIGPSARRIDLDRRDAGDRAVVLSEFGGIALAAEGTWGYQQVDSADELLDRYRSLWSAVHASDTLAGACWTQLTDTYQEANGLVTMDRRPKFDAALIAIATRGPANPAEAKRLQETIDGEMESPS
ncbi:MAG: glycoside hydrolase family 2, partial [Actinomycetota bacterium]|nr:glycoside hydrolase family 2 [Actinomycetota bacterium]